MSSVDTIDKPVYNCSICDEFEEIASPDCEILLDSGNTACDLLLSYLDASKFKLRVSKSMKEVHQVDGVVAIARMIPSLWVSFALLSPDGKITIKGASLDSWVELK